MPISISEAVESRENKEVTLTITETQAKQLIMCLENAIFLEGDLDIRYLDVKETRVKLIDTSYDLMYALGDKINVSPEEHFIDIQTLEVKEH